MRYDWVDAYLLAKPAVTKDLQAEWNWIRYKIGDKMFAAILLDDDDKPVYINLKLEPTEGEFLRGPVRKYHPRLLFRQALLELRQPRWRSAGRTAEIAAGQVLRPGAEGFCQEKTARAVGDQLLWNGMREMRSAWQDVRGLQ